MDLAVVRNLGSSGALRSAQDDEGFDEELVDLDALSMAVARLSAEHSAASRPVVLGFTQFLAWPVRTASTGDSDRFLVEQRRREAPVSHATTGGVHQ